MKLTMRLIVVISSTAMLAVGCGGAKPLDLAAAQSHAAYRLYWAGPSVGGRPLAKVLSGADVTTLVYGTCTPQPTGDETSCNPPLEIQVASICNRNALLLDIRPSSRSRARGASVLGYGDGQYELGAGASAVVVWARPALARRAIAALRPFRDPYRPRLPRPRYPRYYLAQLRRVYDAYSRTLSIDAVRGRLRISRSAVRFELGLARDIGPGRLDRGGRDGLSLDQVKRDRLAGRRHGCSLEYKTGR